MDAKQWNDALRTLAAAQEVISDWGGHDESSRSDFAAEWPQLRNLADAILKAKDTPAGVTTTLATAQQIAKRVIDFGRLHLDD